MTVDIRVGDARALLAAMPAASVHCIVTSPPYYGLRDYGVAGQMGLEPTLAEFIAGMVALFREARRVLRDDGTLWLNIGDSYVSNGRYDAAYEAKAQRGGMHADDAEKYATHDPRPAARAMGLKPKDLMMVPARLAIALQDDGWWVRKDIIWHKPNPMPESCTDRPTSSHEHIFLLAKSEQYYFDAHAVREAMESGPSDLRKMQEGLPRIGGKHKDLDDGLSKASAATNIGKKRSVGDPAAGRNLRDVWTMATVPYPGSHFATFPPELPERCIKAGTSERGCCPACGAPWARMVEKGNLPVGKNGAALQGGGETGDIRRGPVVHSTTTGWQPSCACPPAEPRPCVVLDPFGGAGTTGMVANRLGRDAILLELNPEYAAMSETRLAADRGELPIEGVGLFAVAD